MPPSFKGADGNIVYSLEARLSRSMRIDKKDLTKLTFVPRVDWSLEPELAVGVGPHVQAIPRTKMCVCAYFCVLNFHFY